ncbi:cobalamin B12-binding domain-containing protein [Desulfatibacillum aliphaticivorans]|uniref:cobalamin B12-binding domain-containing protein n=1 Tax=Desulfatibacillum aliphaticivorans TaxID=218208 RepID=UPI0004208C8C|nr:cobalamin-dependent protein [Desulfatibacillum aliphaticivorans]
MITEDLYNEYFNHLLGGRRIECTRIVQGLLDQRIDIKELYVDLFQKSLYETGRLWETNKISVAREHLVTAITENLLNLVYPRLFHEEKNDKKAVISCTANEFHQIGGKMAADILETHGWSSYFLGANTPLDHMLAFIDEVKPDLVGMSLSVYFNMPSLIQGIEAVKAEFGSLDIAVGGQGLNWGGADKIKKYANTFCVFSLAELEKI